MCKHQMRVKILYSYKTVLQTILKALILRKLVKYKIKCYATRLRIQRTEAWLWIFHFPVSPNKATWPSLRTSLRVIRPLHVRFYTCGTLNRTISKSKHHLPKNCLFFAPLALVVYNKLHIPPYHNIIYLKRIYGIFKLLFQSAPWNTSNRAIDLGPLTSLGHKVT
jgi:hypothetical protein